MKRIVRDVIKSPFSAAHFLSLSFFLVIMGGTMILMLPISTENGISFVDALFTATSAVCVTGLVVVDTATAFTAFGQLVILLLIQIGGLGIMTFAAATIWIFKQRLTLSERSLMEYSFLQGKREFSLGQFVFFLIKYTFLIELVGMIGYLFVLDDAHLPTRIFNAVFLAVSSFCNAGFALYSDNLVKYHADIGVNVITMFLIVLGGIGFLVAFEVKNKAIRWLKREKAQYTTQVFSLHTWTVLTMTGILIFGGAAFIYFFQYIAHAALSVQEALFLSVTSRTAGFNTIDVGTLQTSTLLIVSTLMFIGGSPGSCAGGIKTTTFAILVFIMFIGKDNFEDVTAHRRSIPHGTIVEALLVFVFGFSIVFVSVLLLSVFEAGIPFIRLLFETVSAFGTVGLSTGITSELRWISKIILILTMFCGRVGSLTIFSIILNRKPVSGVKYAEERILIG